MNAPRATTLAACGDLIVRQLSAVGIDTTRPPYRCPACLTPTPTLSIDVTDGRRIRPSCTAGCDEAEILRALNLTTRDLTPTPTERSRSPVTGDLHVAAPLLHCQPGPDPGPGPGPGVTSGGDDEEFEPELYELLRAYRRGEVEPEPVQLGAFPAGRVPEVARRIAEHMALCVGLRRRYLEDRPLPYATSFCVAEVESARDKRHASRALRWLERYDVIRCVGTMPRRPGGPPNGTKLYEPGLGVRGASPAEVATAAGLETLDGGEVVEERVGLDPPVEAREQRAVDDAVGITEPPARPVGVITRRDGAGTTLGHGSDDNGLISCGGAGRGGHNGGRGDHLRDDNPADWGPDAEHLARRLIDEFDAVEVDEDCRPLATVIETTVEGACKLHRGNAWRRIDRPSRWTCGTCHPPAPGIPAEWERGQR